MSESAGQAVSSPATRRKTRRWRRASPRRSARAVWRCGSTREGGLVGGDAWDRKSREQIAPCALFVPLVSITTPSRKEGYLRLQWHLAEERARLMAKGVPFIVPASLAPPSAAPSCPMRSWPCHGRSCRPVRRRRRLARGRKKLLAPPEVARSFHPSCAPKIDPGSKVRGTPTTPTTSHAHHADDQPRRGRRASPAQRRSRAARPTPCAPRATLAACDGGCARARGGDCLRPFSPAAAAPTAGLSRDAERSPGLHQSSRLRDFTGWKVPGHGHDHKRQAAVVAARVGRAGNKISPLDQWRAG